MCNACIPMLNETQAIDDFADKLLGMLNQGALSLMVSIGHRTGLFDQLGEIGWANEETISANTGLDQRYIREWLAALVSAQVIQYRPDSKEYHLPDNHAALLCRKSSPDNIAVFAQYIGMLGKVEDDIIDCFRHGGGVGYDKFPTFHQVMSEDSGQTVLAGLDEYILPLVKNIEEKLSKGINVLDIGCGQRVGTNSSG